MRWTRNKLLACVAGVRGMRYSYGNGPQSLAFVIYAGLAILLGLPFLSEGDERLERVWEIYMTPMFDEEPIFPLVFAAVTSLGLSLIYFSKWFSEFSSRPSTGRVCALLSIILLLNALINFSHLVVYGFLFATFPTLWAWWRSDPDDNWL